MDKDLSGLPAVFRPTGRLFLSVDLVGSTAHKQSAAFPLSMDGGRWPENELSPPWLSPISDFFSEFGNVFQVEWDAYRTAAQGQRMTAGDAPRLWKANGDELIYVKELADRVELYGCVNVWIKAIKAYRRVVRKSGNLDLKATCWFAGFPITNSEVVFRKNRSDISGEFRDDPRLMQILMREKWHRGGDVEKDYILDYIGPTIDIGFRLRDLSTSRRFVISLDVAYLASTAHIPTVVGMDGSAWFLVAYDGQVALKGVLNGRPYPVFWIDLGADEPMVLAEDNLGSKVYHASRDEVKAFCLHFYSENKSNFLVPFLLSEGEAQSGELPENYKMLLLRLQSRWESEKLRYELEQDVSSSEDERGAELSQAQIAEIAKLAAEGKA